MPDYQLSKIYKLWSPSTNLIYIGSTTQSIAQRLADHIKTYRRFKNDKYPYTTSFKILECEDYKIELIESYSCNNRTQLLKKEGEYIKSLECINKRIEGRTKEDHKKYLKEYNEKNKASRQEYRENNKASKQEYDKEYREKNKEKIKIYKEKNKERLKEKSKIYREKNKEKRKEYRKQYNEKKKL